MRIAKFIAQSGYCSRREAEKLIIEKRITINSYTCEKLGTIVSQNDEIKVNGKKIFLPTNVRMWKFYKPIGIITTSKDPQSRKTIYDILPGSIPRVISIGRLDINSEGLLLLTNNGNLARHIELPKNKFIRKYRVRLKGLVDKKKLQSLSSGINIDNTKYKAIKAKLIKQNSSNAWITMELSEGKNREIRKICNHFGWQVNRLIRTHYGEYSLQNLKPGDLQEIKNHSFQKYGL